MAKKDLTLFHRSPPTQAPVVVVAPRGRGRIRRAASRVGGLARRAGRGAGRVAKHHGVPAMGMALGGAVAGILDAKGILNRLPALGGSRALTLAAAGYAATRFSKNNTVRMIGLAAIAVGAFDAAKSHINAAPLPPANPPAKGKGPSGHDDDSGATGDGGPY